MIKYDKDSESYIIDPDNEDRYTAYDFESIESIDALSDLVLRNKTGKFDYIDKDGYTPLCFAALNNVDPKNIIYMASPDEDIKLDPIVEGSTIKCTSSDGFYRLVFGDEDLVISLNKPSELFQPITIKSKSLTGKNIKLSATGAGLYNEIDPNNPVIGVEKESDRFSVIVGDAKFSVGSGFIAINDKKYNVSSDGISLPDNILSIKDNSLFIGEEKFLTVSSDKLEFSATIGNYPKTLKLKLVISSDKVLLSLNDVRIVDVVPGQPIIIDGIPATISFNDGISVDVGDLKKAFKINKTSFSLRDSYDINLNGLTLSLTIKPRFDITLTTETHSTYGIVADIPNKYFRVTVSGASLDIQVFKSGFNIGYSYSDTKIKLGISFNGTVSVSYNKDTVELAFSTSDFTIIHTDNSGKTSLRFFISSSGKFSIDINNYVVSFSATDGITVNNIPIFSFIGLDNSFVTPYWGDTSAYKGKAANINKVCDKGKSPIQMAIMSQNAAIVKTLLGTSSYTVPAVYKKARSPANTNDYYYYKPEITNNNYPIFISKDTVKFTDGSLSLKNTGISISKNDILNAASSKSNDLLKALGDSNAYSGQWYGVNNRFNEYGYTPLMESTKASCYASIRYILSKIEDSENRVIAIEEKSFKLLNDSSTQVSALSIAVNNKDFGAQKIFAEYSSDDAMISAAVRGNSTDTLGVILTSKQSDSLFNIFNWTTDDNEPILTKEFTDDSGNKMSILSYINDNYKDSSDDSIKYFTNQIVSTFNEYNSSQKESFLRILVNNNNYVIIRELFDLSNINSTKFPTTGSMFDIIKSKHDSVSDSSLLEIYISSQCYYLVKLLISRSISESTNFKLKEAEYSYLSTVEDSVVNEIFVDQIVQAT